MAEIEKSPVVCKKEECDFLQGNVIEFEVKKDDCEIRADVTVKQKKCVRVYGRVKDCHGEPVEAALVKLLKKDKKKNAFIGVAHGITDCEGFYQFDICGCDETGSFKIVVSKAASGKERVICDKGECEPCDKFDKED